MVKAILRNGAIVPLESLPSEWEDGAPLEVARANGAALEVDAWAKQMNELCADSTGEDEQSMQAAIAEHRRAAKEQARREMRLPE